MLSLASAIGLFLMLSIGIRMVLHDRAFERVIGLAVLAHAMNLILLYAGKTDPHTEALGTAAFLGAGKWENAVDPLPQALILTAIVIGFGMTAVLLTFEILHKKRPPQ